MITKLVYVFETGSNPLCLLPTFTMPAPDLKRAPLKGPSEGSPYPSPDATPTTIAVPNAPKYSGPMNEAWNAANAELPQAQGLEKFLNRVGALIASVPHRLCANA